MEQTKIKIGRHIVRLTKEEAREQFIASGGYNITLDPDNNLCFTDVRGTKFKGHNPKLGGYTPLKDSKIQLNWYHNRCRHYLGRHRTADEARRALETFLRNILLLMAEGIASDGITDYEQLQYEVEVEGKVFHLTQDDVDSISICIRGYKYEYVNGNVVVKDNEGTVCTPLAEERYTYLTINGKEATSNHKNVILNIRLNGYRVYICRCNSIADAAAYGDKIVKEILYKIDQGDFYVR